MKEVVIHFRLVGLEADGLATLAATEYRSPRDQLRFLLRQELLRRGLIESTNLDQDLLERTVCGVGL